jgi:hypothetical protein
VCDRWDAPGVGRYPTPAHARYPGRVREDDADANRRAEPVSATVLPELAAESVETAERLVRLSAEEGLDSAEAEYILASGLAAIQRVPGLWPITRGRIGGGTTAATAHLPLARLRDAVDKNLFLAGIMKKLARAVREEVGREPEVGPGLDAAEDRLLEIRTEAAGLLAVIDAPARWPDAEQLREAKEGMRRGDRLSAEEFRRALLDEQGRGGPGHDLPRRGPKRRQRLPAWPGGVY